MCVLKFNSYVLIAFFSFLKSTKCEFLCDEYVHSNKDSQFFTIAGYTLPRSKYSQKIYESVPCPCSATQPCLRKCCLGDDVFTLSTKKCHQSNDTTDSEAQKFDSENLPNIPVGDYTLIYGSLCPSVSRSLDALKVAEDGSFELQNHYLSLQKHCIEYFEEEKDFRLLECKEKTPDASASIRKLVIILMTISIFCLIVTLFVYLSIKKLRNLPGKILICYVSSFLSTEICLIVMQFISVAHGNICLAAGKMLIIL